MRIDLVIVSFRSERWLPKCLSSIYGGGFSGRCWLIDNHQLDSGVVAELVERFPHVTYLRNERNLGFGRGCNVGIRRALESGADVIGLVNPDTWFEPGFERSIEVAFGSGPDVGMVSPLQLAYDSDEHAAWTQATLARLGSAGSGDHLEVDWIEASGVFIGAPVFNRIGYFDELYELYYEDNDLCRRATRAGFRLLIDLGSRYHHFTGASLDGAEGRRRSMLCDRSQAIYLATNPAQGLLANFFAVLRMLARRGFSRSRHGWGGVRYGCEVAIIVVRLLLVSGPKLVAKWNLDRKLTQSIG